jgi:hypothetical protein
MSTTSLQPSHNSASVSRSFVSHTDAISCTRIPFRSTANGSSGDTAWCSIDVMGWSRIGPRVRREAATEVLQCVGRFQVGLGREEVVKRGGGEVLSGTNVDLWALSP